jgi:CDP-paratose synthetase
MKTILITGINGYLGSKLAKRYTKKYNVIGLEYSSENLFRLRGEPFKVFASQEGIPDELFDKNKIDIIIHTATFYGRDNESDTQMTYANMYLPQMLLEKVIKNGCKLFINTDTVLDRFTSSYALTKKQFGDWLKFYAQTKKIQVLNLQLEHFYGPGSAPTNFITLMVQKMLMNEPVISLTKAEQNRDFLYVDDLLRVYDLMLEKANVFTNYEIINVGAGLNTNLKYILEYIKKKSSSISTLDFGAIPYRVNELMESHNDISNLVKFGWKANFTIEQGLDRVISYEKKMKRQKN